MNIKILGDTHLGRRFTKDVALERRGEREKLVREDFVRQLDPAGADVHIHMGDIFDKPQVDYDTLLFAAQAYRAAATSNPRTTFYIIQGNHDDSRDFAEVTAWDVFGQLVRGFQNIVCVIDSLVGPDFLILPWHPTRTAVEQLDRVREPLVLSGFRPKLAYGHWDTDPRGSHHNLIPTVELAELGVERAYTGHVHLPTTFHRDGVDVTVVGSMQPYAQGEDGGQGSVRYVTLDLERLHELMEVAPASLCNACVRLRLAPGEQYDGEIPDCWSWNVERARPVAADEEPEDASMEGFDTAKAGKAALDEHDIIPEVRAQIEAKWEETFGRGLPE